MRDINKKNARFIHAIGTPIFTCRELKKEEKYFVIKSKSIIKVDSSNMV